MSKLWPERFSCLLALPLLAAMSACGGGGGGGSTTSSNSIATPSVAISGVAAAGTAINGIVFVKGANGVTTSTVIQSSGQFTLDVSALTPNYLLYAEGLSGDKLWRVYSIASTGGTINVTPLTDLVVSNALGQLPGAMESSSSLFNAWNGGQLTAPTIASAKSTVQTSLLPLLAGMGVSTDLMTGSFSANHAGMDGVLDALDISYAGTVATVTNRFTGHSFTDDVANHGATATSLPANDATLSQQGLADSNGIQAIFSVEQNLRTRGISSQDEINSQIGPLVAPDFFGGGMTKAQYLVSCYGGSPSPGIPGFTEVPVIVSSIPTQALSATAYLRGYYINVINSYNYGGSAVSTLNSVVTPDGTHWLIYGDRRDLSVKIEPGEVQSFNADGTTTMTTGLDLECSDPSGYTSGLGLQSAIITGPGLPSQGAIMTQSHFHDGFYILAENASLFPLTDNRVIASIPDNATYNMYLYTDPATTVSLQTSIPVVSYTGIPMSGAAPLLTTQLGQSMFPTFVPPASHDLASANIGGQLSATWTNPSSGLEAVIDVELTWQTATGQEVVASFPSNYGAQAQTVTLPDTTGTAFNAHLTFLSFDTYGRGYASIWFFQ